MKFTKPINREVEIDGVNFILALDDNGIELRIKGKRKTAKTTWPQVLDVAVSDSGESARDLFGIRAAVLADQGQPQASASPDGSAGGSSPAAHPYAGPDPQARDAAAHQFEKHETEPQNLAAETPNTADEHGLAASAGDGSNEN